MLAQAVVAFFKHKVVSSIIVLSCWLPVDQIKFTRQLSQCGMSVTFSCDPAILDHIRHHYLQGVLYMTHENDDMPIFEKIKKTHFMKKYKWLILGDHVPDVLRNIRYDSDVAFLESDQIANNETRNYTAVTIEAKPTIHIYDIYVHPTDGIAINLWAYWTNSSGLVLMHEQERIFRRKNLKRYPMRVATPQGHYSNAKYDGSFVDFLEDENMLDQDPGIRSGYETAILLTEAMNAQFILIINELWVSTMNNNSMYLMVSKGEAEISGAILRLLWERTFDFDFIIPIWPFRVGFTYLSERESSSNMYLEPFSPAVWWSCLAMIGILALVERITSKSPKEKDGALYTVLTTWLQQDASAVPEGGSGRFAFTVLSLSSMLVHAYYSSAIISALMSTGQGGPDSLKALADSKYAIASEDYGDMRRLFFDVKTKWDDVEYLKKKKMTPHFYQELERGVELIQQGSTAFHSEYNQIYQHFKTFSDEQICKLQHVDTIPESLTWLQTSKDGQWAEVLRTTGAWVLETGLGNRLVKRLSFPKPPCRAALLAERVKLGDIAPLLVLSIFGAVLSIVLLGVEIIFAKAKRGSLRARDGKHALGDVNDDSEVVLYDSNIEYSRE